VNRIPNQSNGARQSDPAPGAISILVIVPGRRQLVSLVALVGTALVLGVLLPGVAAAIPARAGEAAFPVFDVGGDDHDLGQGNDVFFDLYDMNAAPKAAEITIQTPKGYTLSLVHRAGFVFGDAEVDTNRGSYKGEFEVAGHAEFDADPATAGCADGTHAATWWLVLNGTHGELSVPVAVDHKGSGDLFTICLGSLQKLHLTMSEIYFNSRDVFRNPTKPGDYRFSAIVTPVGTDGMPDPTTRYELRGFQPLPETATPTAVYDPATKTLTVTGKLVAAGHGRVGINVHIYAGASTDYEKLVEVGHAATTAGGAYTVTRRLAKAPLYVYAYVEHYRYAICSGASSAPAGCASQSTDGLATDNVKVTTAAA
jgi:hypothetical protein